MSSVGITVLLPCRHHAAIIFVLIGLLSYKCYNLRTERRLLISADTVVFPVVSMHGVLNRDHRMMVSIDGDHRAVSMLLHTQACVRVVRWDCAILNFSWQIVFGLQDIIQLSLFVKSPDHCLTSDILGVDKELWHLE